MKLDIRNFRSIRDQSVELAPITVVYGPNGSGKSSLLYSLLAMKDIVLNPNSSTDSFFDFGFVNLGSFEALVHNHHPDKEIQFQIEATTAVNNVKWSAQFSKQDGRFLLSMNAGKDNELLSFELPVSFPYRVDNNVQQKVNLTNQSVNVIWDGINAHLESVDTSVPNNQSARDLATILNTPVEILRKTGAVPLQRGFSRDSYSVVPVSPSLINEDEMASLLVHDKYLEPRVSRYLELITGRELRVRVRPGTSVFTLDVSERSTGVGTEIVNDGFGVNQLAWFLARTLHSGTTWMCVEEPETHLHPSAIRKMAYALVDIVHEEGKRFLITTHSEALVLALLSEVTRKRLKPEEVAFYLTNKEGRETHFERQEVNELGQVDGGLSSFMEGELEEIAAFFGREE